MWADINGERKKVACGPCIRGHRSSKCDHRDRVLVEVRKPGRPLSSCPHPTGSCSCERVVINYTIPKTSTECACPSERQSATATPGGSNRVQKSKHKKSTSTFNPANLEKAIKADQDADTDASSHFTRTSTNPSLAASDKSGSNGVSPASSASSTPRIHPSPSRKQSHDIAEAQLPKPVSDCCKPKPSQQAPETTQRSSGSCCGNKSTESPKAAPAKKSCCSGPKQAPQEPNTLQNPYPALGNFPQFSFQNQYQMSQTPPINPNMNYISQMLGNGMNNIGMSMPFGFNTPIFNHLSAIQQQQAAMSVPSMHNGNGHSQDGGSSYSCHCGDSCSCFGCAAHPNNATMTEYVRLMDQYAQTGGCGPVPPPTYDLPAYPHQAGYGAENPQNMGFNNPIPGNFSQFSGASLSYPTNMNMMGMANNQVHNSNAWQTGPMQRAIPTAFPAFVPDNPATQDKPPILGIKTEEPVSTPTVAESPKEEKEGEETPTLSPSSYFWQELVLPGCNDATGTCQCGDGCDCVGCLTHGGHNGVPLEPTTSEQDAFNQFMSPTNDLGHGQYVPTPFPGGAPT